MAFDVFVTLTNNHREKYWVNTMIPPTEKFPFWVFNLEEKSMYSRQVYLNMYTCREVTLREEKEKEDEPIP